MEPVPNRAPRPNKSGTMAGSFKSRKIADAQQKADAIKTGLISNKYVTKAKRKNSISARSGEEEMLLLQEGKDISNQNKRPGVYAKGKSKKQG